MTAAAAPTDAIRRRSLAGAWLRHAVSLVFPLTTLAFLWTGPHPWWVATLFLAPGVAMFSLDRAGRPTEERAPLEDAPDWPFDALVYVLAGLQFWIIAEVVWLFGVAGQGFFSFDMLGVVLVVGGSSGFSIVTAHELIHRKRPWEQNLGRLLLCSVLYEHFYTEHLRGHHALVGTPDDPATARFGEAYEPFFRRTVPAQLKSAWRLEKKRLGDEEMGLLDPRMLRNRVLHGLLLEWGVAFAIWAAFGGVAFLAFVLQAFMAVRALEAVNYFEHWGLQRSGPRVKPSDSWDTHSWFSYYSLIGLTRHADHHAYPVRPYQKLRVHEEAPILPAGYVVMVDDVMSRNAAFQQAATLELARRRAGPFVPAEGEATEPLTDDAALARLAQAQDALRAQPTRPPGALRKAWAGVPLPIRIGSVLALLVVATAGGAHWETGGADLGLGARILFHTAILAAFAVILPLRARIEPTTGGPASWVLAFAALAVWGLGLGVLF
jgi:alkane 1-monooxygenase